MIRKALISIALACCVAGVLQASSYPGDQPSLAKQPAVMAYSCNWADNLYIRYYTKQLKRYGIQSVFYPYQLRIVIPDYVLFAPMTDTMIQSAQDPFYLLAALLELLPGSKIKVIGYSDNIATSDVNQQQSMLQAQKLSAYLWMNHIPNKTQSLKYLGAGEGEPLVDNNRINNMALNRRVEVWVTVPH